MAGAHANRQQRRRNQDHRRAADFPVRQWLKLGAASAGMGAALLGFSLMGPSTGTAAADSTTKATSPSSQASSAGESRSSSGRSDDSRGDDADTTAGAANADDDVAGADDDTSERRATKTTNSRRAAAEDTAANDAEDAAADDDVDDEAEDDEAPRLVQQPSTPTAVDAAADDDPPDEIKQPPAPAPASLRQPKTWNDVVGDILDRWSDGTVAWIKTLRASDATKADLEASMWAVRRTFFNQAPTLDPIQVAGLTEGDITGEINAEDIDGDQLIYRLVIGPKFGTVILDNEGGYTYTPGEGFVGVDSFQVMALDAGLHVNLLNPFRARGTSASNVINQNAIKFAFTYDGDEWTAERRAKLEEVAGSLREYFRVNKAVTLTFAVDEEDEPGTLASADSARISTAPGYWRTVVQNKLQTGEDANGAAADGQISWNWGDGNIWALGDEVSDEEYDFTSVAIHELMHAFGWGSTLKKAGENQGTNRDIYDRFIVTADGLPVLTNLQWSPANDPKLTGGDRGLYFGGANAIEAYGGYLVPLRTSIIWGNGSSIHHLSDTTFAGTDQKIMNSGTDKGPAPRVFSELEIAILQDLGYDAVLPDPPPYAPEPPAEVNAEDDAPQQETPRPPAPAPASLAQRRTWNEVVAQIVDNWTASNQAWIDSLDVDEQRKAELEESFSTFRRTFLNQAPTVDPVQVTGLIGGSITGAINGVDADGDAIRYRLVSGPRQGSVVLNDDGTYTYTPGEGFDGVDSFRVIAIDSGLHLNLLNPLRGLGTRAFNLINQSAITFEFSYTGDDWTEERREALEQAAQSLLEYFRVDRPVTLTYDVKLEDPGNPDRGLASASSPFMSKLPGFWDTVVQHKLLTGRDANGDKADGEISWNFADHNWALGDVVGDDEYDFVSTAIHELMHSFGFLSSLSAPGENRGANRSTYDRFTVTVAGAGAFPLSEWATINDPKLTGDDGALYFGGANAIAAYNGYLVPLFTPAEWKSGSSMSHVDDFTFVGANQKIMNAETGFGLVTRVFSEMELGILRDLGYHVVMPETPPYSGAALL